jgi:hypothetical protein
MQLIFVSSCHSYIILINCHLFLVIRFLFSSFQQIIMECNSSDVQMPQCAEGSETTIEIKIKTLDSQTYNLRVNKCVSW